MKKISTLLISLLTLTSVSQASQTGAEYFTMEIKKNSDNPVRVGTTDVTFFKKMGRS